MSLAPVEFPVGHVFQSGEGLGGKTITFSATFTGTNPTGLDAKVDISGGANVVSYTALSSFTITGVGTCQGTLFVPDCDLVVVTLRNNANSDVGTQSNTWGIGTRVFLLGASISQALFNRADAVTTPDAHARVRGFSTSFAGNGAWHNCDKALDGSTGGEALNQLAIKLRSYIGGTKPLGIVVGEVDNTSAASWITGQSSWTAAIGANGWGSSNIVQGTDFEAAFICIGGVEAGGTNTSSYQSNLAAIAAQCLSLSGRSSIKFGILQTGSLTSSGNNTDMNTTRAAEWTASQTTNCFFAGTALSVPLVDGAHQTNAGTIRDGHLIANAIGKALGLRPYGSEGPRIGSAWCALGSTTVYFGIIQASGGMSFVDGSGAATNSSLAGFVLTASGGQTWTPKITSGVMTAELSSPRLVGQTFSFTYGAGLAPLGNPYTAYNDNTPYDDRATYLGDSRGFQLLPTVSAISIGLSGSPVFIHHLKQQMAA